jgi:hypothetical protein
MIPGQPIVIDPRGYFSATHVYKRNGVEIPRSEALTSKQMSFVQDIKRQNLVVNTGRQHIARSLGGYWQTADPVQINPYINRLIVGTGNKAGNLPNLSDTGLVTELRKLDGTVSGTFLLDGPWSVTPEVTFPSLVWRGGAEPPNDWLSSGAITINVDNETILTDATVNFLTLGVALTDQVTLDNSPTNPAVLGVREIRSATELVLHNPYGITSADVAYRIGTPGTQVLVSKLIEGNDFPQDDWGSAIILKEAGLLLSNSVLFNRVVFAPSDEEAGLLLQSDEALGVEVSIRFEWLITI